MAQAENHCGIPIGTKLRVRASVVLGEIPPEYVRVQAVSGSVNADGVIVHGDAIDMTPVSHDGDRHLYQGDIECVESGSCGFSVRVIPKHDDVIVPYEHPWVQWAE